MTDKYRGKNYTSPMREFQITCARCEIQEVTHEATKYFAEASWREDGWAKRKGVWVCSACRRPTP